MPGFGGLDVGSSGSFSRFSMFGLFFGMGRPGLQEPSGCFADAFHEPARDFLAASGAFPRGLRLAVSFHDFGISKAYQGLQGPPS